MSSIIKNANNLGITYSATSKTLYDGSRENVFTDDSSYFRSEGSTSEQWWQVSFSKAVSISSYIIKSSTQHVHRPKAWEVMASMNGIQWEVVDRIAGKDTAANTDIFIPYFTVNCMHFRIVFKENYNNNEYMRFTFFDCFGGLGNNNTKNVRYNQCYCNTVRSKNILSFRVMLYSFMISAL